MTTERTEAVQFDTLEEVERLESAGVPRDHAAAMLYAAVRASDARYGALEAKIDRLADTMNEKFAAVDENFKAVYARFDAVDLKFDAVNENFRAVYGRFDAIDAKFDAVNLKFDAVNDNFKAVYGRFDSIDLNFKATDTRFDTVDDRFKAADAKATGMRWQWVAIGLLSGGVVAAASQTIAAVAAIFR